MSTENQIDNISSVGMDQAIASRRIPSWLIISAVLLVLMLVIFVMRGQIQSQGSLQSVEFGRLQTDTVKAGLFEDFVPIRGIVTPERTTFLDAVEGGRVEEIYIEDGTIVKAGDLIAVLSNSQLQLDVLAREAAVEEQLNTLRTLELNTERNRLEHIRNIVEIDYQVIRLKRSIERQQSLAAKQGAIVRSELEDAIDELNYQQRRRVVTAEAQETDSRLGGLQLKQLRAASKRLNLNLALAQRNLEALNVRAPVTGTVTSFNAEIGQSLARGQRLGQVDSPEGFKIVAQIDEFYVDRIQAGLSAQAVLSNQSYELHISKVYPQIINGQFTADLLFVGQVPLDIRRGQSLSMRLSLGSSETALIVTNGPFMETTGGHWAFVLDPTNEQAWRVPIRIGRRNSDYVEVLEGLSEGDRVIVSTYTIFGDAKKLAFQGAN